jgi:hypothetical protein
MILLNESDEKNIYEGVIGVTLFWGVVSTDSHIYP